MQQMYGHKRVYQAGQVPDKSVDVAKHITWTAKIVRGKYDEEVKARQNASSSAATTNQEVNWMDITDILYDQLDDVLSKMDYIIKEVDKIEDYLIANNIGK